MKPTVDELEARVRRGFSAWPSTPARERVADSEAALSDLAARARLMDATLKAMELGKFATPHPNGAFGLQPNTWEVPAFVQTMARHARSTP